jgi:hypothetical protein
MMIEDNQIAFFDMKIGDRSSQTFVPGQRKRPVQFCSSDGLPSVVNAAIAETLFPLENGILTKAELFILERAYRHIASRPSLLVSSKKTS